MLSVVFEGGEVLLAGTFMAGEIIREAPGRERCAGRCLTALTTTERASEHP
jgi:hypothetical protein